MFCKDVRCESGYLADPPIEIGGYKMLDVVSSTFLHINNQSELMGYAQLLKFPEHIEQHIAHFQQYFILKLTTLDTKSPFDFAFQSFRL